MPSRTHYILICYLVLIPEGYRDKLYPILDTVATLPLVVVPLALCATRTTEELDWLVVLSALKLYQEVERAVPTKDSEVEPQVTATRGH